MIKNYDIESYLENNSLSIDENYFYNFFKNGKNDLIKKYIKENKILDNKVSLIEIKDTNYHLYSIHLYNNVLNDIMLELNKFYDENIEEYNLTNLNKKLLLLKSNFYVTKFDIPYKVFFNEMYSLDLIPDYKLKQFYEDNPELKPLNN